jgi:FAD binding domain
VAGTRTLGIITILLAIGVSGSPGSQRDLTAQRPHLSPNTREAPLIDSHRHAQANQSIDVFVASNRQTTTPPGCRALKSDESFPPLDVWAKFLPGVKPIRPLDSQKHPDYRFVAKSAADVEKAVTFARDKNIRLTIINTGHDYLARNDAPSGLLLDVSRLAGVITHSDWKPRPGGDPQPDPSVAVNVVKPTPGKQAAVTFGAGMVGSKVNELINDSKIFVISGGSCKSSRQLIKCLSCANGV